MTPKVSVVMPLYNAEKHLRQAIDSVLAQTFTDFEFIIIDDCSTDNTPAILDSYDDPRIVRLLNSQNLGIVGALNRGLDVAHGQYIARMDGDDYSLPTRFQNQVAYLDSHPEVGLLGTRYVFMDDTGAFLYNGEAMPPLPEPSTRGYIKWSLLWMTSIQHPSAMMRREILEQHHLRYDPDFVTAEDYELWARMSHYTVVERLSGVYLHYRMNPQGISLTKREQQLKTHYRITYRELCRLMGETLPDHLAHFLFLIIIVQPDVLKKPLRGSELIEAIELMLRIRKTYFASHTVTPDERRHIQHETRRVLLRVLAYAKLLADRKARLQVQLKILQESPSTFLRLFRQFIEYRFNRLAKGG